MRLLVVGALLALGVPLLSGTASAETFSNPEPIVVPLPPPPTTGCPTPDCPSNKATPYPSEIEVSGVDGTVTDVNVTLHDLTHELNGPDDLDIMLVAPDDTAVMLMSDACGAPENAHFPTTEPITLTLDDAAAAPLPADTACSTGTFQPLDDEDAEFGGGAVAREPDGFPDAPASPASSLLSTFNGIDPNGTWRLYVVDDWPNTPDPNGMAGQIACGWSLVINDPTALPPTTACSADAGPPPPQVPQSPAAVPVAAQPRFTG